MMESLAGYPESPLEPDDAVYPCKGCGEVRDGPLIVSRAAPLLLAPNADNCNEQILEEGKAFELGMFLQSWALPCEIIILIIFQLAIDGI